MLTPTAVRKVLDDIECGDIEFEVEPGLISQTHVHFRVRARRPDNDVPNGWPIEQVGRWWIIENAEGKERLLQTVWLAIQTFEEHELREKFKYRNKAIFKPAH